LLLFNYNEYNLINIFAFFLFFYFTHGFDNCMWIQLHSFSLISQWCNTSQLIQHEQPLCNTFCMVTCSLRIYTFENDHCCFKSIVVTPVASQFNKTLQTYSHWKIWSYPLEQSLHSVHGGWSQFTKTIDKNLILYRINDRSLNLFS
jgi:hypothetical protein